MLIIKLIDTTKKEIIACLKDEGYRISKPRRDIINLLGDIKHSKAEEIVQELEKIKQNVNVSTIYNNLNFLVEKGFIKENKFSNSLFVHYEVKTTEHAHLVCLDFENIADVDVIDLTRIKDEIEEKYDFEIFDVSFNLYGRCSDCHKLSNNSTSTK